MSGATVPPSALSGIVPIPFETTVGLIPTGLAAEGIDMGCDGHWIKPRLNGVYAGTFHLDTTLLADGTHTLNFNVWGTGGILVESERFTITTANGNALASYPVPSVAAPVATVSVLPVGVPIPRLPVPIFPLSMFNLSWVEMAANQINLTLAGFNTYEMQAWPIPVFPQTLWYYLAMGDNLLRTQEERAVFVDSGILPAMAVMKQLAASGKCIGVAFVDESNALIGNPADPAVLAASTALRNMGPLVSWPITLSNPKPISNTIANAWCSEIIADFGCVYPTCLDQYVYYPRRCAQSMSQLRDQIKLFLGCIPLNMPRMVKINAAGNFYVRTTPGASVYSIGDKLIDAATTANQIMGQVGVALCSGACAIRYWAWDWQPWQNARAGNMMGSQVDEGTSPTLGPDRWSALTLVNKAIADLTSRLFAPVQPSPYWGSDWETCARTGLFLGVNCQDRALPLPTLPTGYTTGWTLTPAGRGPFPVAGNLLAPGGWCVLIG